jgi:hypothetical protein
VDGLYKNICIYRIYSRIIGVIMGLFGSSAKSKQISKLGPEQQGLYGQLQQALQSQGAGGAFGSTADYYRDLLDPNSQNMQQMAAPEMRNFQENIIPGLSEQFAGMGSGGLSSSGFRNAAVNAGTDLSERLGALRAQLRQQGAQGLSQLGQFGLGQFNENQYFPSSSGLLGALAPAAGMALGSFLGPAGMAAGGALGNYFAGGGSQPQTQQPGGFGSTSPYGNQSSGQYNVPSPNLPNFSFGR